MGSEINSIAFPFSNGEQGFPKPADPDKVLEDSLKQIVLTGRGERVMRGDLGTNVHRLVFSDFTPILRARLVADIGRAIRQYEPRAEVISIDVDSKDNVIYIDIIYRDRDKVKTVSASVGGD